ncbi:Hypothetical protein, putative [Bodo saltans]|uniref:Uncharacterized protein n=1 Tax=Bodo saltans TaxID=75058 RepID=A0A0S4J209_BODSA|nr:Hypothetical protein, putative [Bodo saltans]|eukprot:CUG15024.1 Hypothetical protein, putative [Bodo saltans]
MPSPRPTRRYDASQNTLGCHLCHTMGESTCATCCNAIFCAHCLVSRQYHTLKRRRLGAVVLEDMIHYRNRPDGRVGRPDDEASDDDEAMVQYRNSVQASPPHDGGLPCSCVMLMCDLTCTLGCALLLGTVLVRGMLRDTFQLRGARCCRCCGGMEYQEHCSDVCIAACCAPCSSCQVEQELLARGCYDDNRNTRRGASAMTTVSTTSHTRQQERTALVGPSPQFLGGGGDALPEPATTPRNPRNNLPTASSPSSPPTQHRQPSHGSPLDEDARGHPLSEIYGSHHNKQDGGLGRVEEGPAVATVPAHYVLAPPSQSSERTSSVMPMPAFRPIATDDDESDNE